jgi:hypothetical protein
VTCTDRHVAPSVGSAHCHHCGTPVSLAAPARISAGHVGGHGAGPIIEPDFAVDFPHPGPMPRLPRFGGVGRRFPAMGTLAGRHRTEIEAAVGPPQAWGVVGPGLFLAQWDAITAGSGYSIGLLFDRGDVCGGVTHESAVQPPCGGVRTPADSRRRSTPRRGG